MRLSSLSPLAALLVLACGTDADPLSAGGGGGGGGGGSGLDGGFGSGGDGGGGGSFSDSSVCEVRDIDNGRKAPDMLIVLDRSGSMDNNGVNRWGPSVSALKTITSSLNDNVKFGLMTFPGTPVTNGQAPADCQNLGDLAAIANCIAGLGAGVGSSCAAGTVNVPVGPMQAGAISSALDLMRPNGGTPTAASLQAAHTALGSADSGNIDVVAGAKYVLLVTDGEPNCSAGNGGGGRDPQAVTESVAAIQAMSGDGIKTYVLGYDIGNGSDAANALNQMATAGGTGDQTFRAINDEASLLAEFQKIAGSVVSCEFTLNQAPPDPTYVLIKLDGAQLNLDDPNGWSISSDRLHVTINGSSCEKLKSTEQHNLSVSVECNQVTLR